MPLKLKIGKAVSFLLRICHSCAMLLSLKCYTKVVTGVANEI